jgi:pantetheine-phosphate adenylyltransferase
MRSAVYPGTFDPVTNGHLDVIKRALTVFDRLIVAVAANQRKSPLFTAEERMSMLKQATKGLRGVEVDSVEGLVVDYALRRKAPVVVRGLRAVSDFEYELQMALMNRNLNPRVDTIFLMPSQQHIYLNSGMVKEIASLGGSLAGLVPPAVARALLRKLA